MKYSKTNTTVNRQPEETTRLNTQISQLHCVWSSVLFVLCNTLFELSVIYYIITNLFSLYRILLCNITLQFAILLLYYLRLLVSKGIRALNVDDVLKTSMMSLNVDDDDAEDIFQMTIYVSRHYSNDSSLEHYLVKRLSLPLYNLIH